MRMRWLTDHLHTFIHPLQNHSRFQALDHTNTLLLTLPTICMCIGHTLFPWFAWSFWASEAEQTMLTRSTFIWSKVKHTNRGEEEEEIARDAMWPSLINRHLKSMAHTFQIGIPKKSNSPFSDEAICLYRPFSPRFLRLFTWAFRRMEASVNHAPSMGSSAARGRIAFRVESTGFLAMDRRVVNF